jgi:hypothetical protein
MAKKVKKLPADTNKRAKSIVDMVTGDKEDTMSDDQLSKAMAILGRKGGLKGGKARAAALSPKKRSDIAKKAAAARWKDKDKKD